MTVERNPLHYEDPLLAQLYDLDSGWSVDRDFYLERAGLLPKRILDLGCGTGLLCHAYAARGHGVTGVDPAAAMLEVARRKPNGASVTWIEASAQDFRSAARFDLIIMTGNAFQTLLSQSEVAAALTTMRMHLAAGGEIVFETRNPAIDWPARWDAEWDLALDGQVIRETRRLLRFDGRRMAFDTGYAFLDRTMVSHSELLFMSRDEVVAQIEAAGLQVETVLGDWDGEVFDPVRSEEMVFVARH